jgi:hypothetical protein
MSADVVAGRPPLIGQAGRETLARMLRVMFPHRGFPAGPYERTVDALLADAAATPYLGAMVAQGVRDLDALAGGSFASLDEVQAYALLERIQGTPFFGAVRTKAVTTMYSDPEVHEALGYEGPSFAKGGYLHRGFDDLDWLPDPPV